MKLKLKNKTFILAVLALLSICLLPGVQAKYTTKGAAADNARVATFNVTTQDLDNTTFEKAFTVKMNPIDSSSQNYDFKVTNSSEVSVKMTASLEMIGNLPLTVECKKNNSKMDKSNNTTDEKKTYTWEDGLGNGDNNYTITVSWIDGKNSYIYENGVEAVKLTVIASQVD